MFENCNLFSNLLLAVAISLYYFSGKNKNIKEKQENNIKTFKTLNSK